MHQSLLEISLKFTWIPVKGGSAFQTSPPHPTGAFFQTLHIAGCGHLSAWGDIKDLTPAGIELLADGHIHLNTARRLVEEVTRFVDGSELPMCLPFPPITHARAAPQYVAELALYQ